jgi:hypothetical protein
MYVCMYISISISISINLSDLKKYPQAWQSQTLAQRQEATYQDYKYEDYR